jgi:outer membrane protein assembly factor BamB
LPGGANIFIFWFMAAMRTLCSVVAFLSIGASVFAQAESQDWPRFGWNAAGSNAPTVRMGVDAENVGSLARQRIAIDGTVDSSAIYLRGVIIGGAVRDAFFVTTTYGKTIAIDADSGRTLWEFTPPGYGSLAGSYRITNATPVADPDRSFVYAAAPDGMIRKLAVADGRVVWSTAITRLPEREKIASALNFSGGRVIAATDGYIGDRPPYQGHVAVLDAGTGALLTVWNSLGSDRHELLDPASYPHSDSGIWGRAGVVVDPADGDLYVATGNGLWDGVVNWGDAVVELDPGATRILGNFTPIETRRLDEEDLDLGSTSPALLGGGLIAQGGKDGWIRLLDWGALRGAVPHRGGEIDRVPTPSGDLMFTAPAVLRVGAATWLLAADGGATAAWTLDGGRLRLRWRAESGGTSPVVVDGLAFVYDPRGGLRVLEATTGVLVATLECDGGHWNSPIVADGRVALPEGNANRHATSGVLDIWRIPAGPSR